MSGRKSTDNRVQPDAGVAYLPYFRWLLLMAVPLLFFVYLKIHFDRLQRKVLENSQTIAQEVEQRKSLQSHLFGLSDSSEQLRQNVSESDRVINQVLKSALAKNRQQVTANRDLLEKQQPLINGLSEHLAQLARVQAESKEQWEASVQDQGREMEIQMRAVRDLNDHLNSLQTGFNSQSSEMERLEAKLDQVASLTARIRSENLENVKDLRGLNEDVSGKITRMQRDLVRLRSSLEDLRSEVDRLRSNVANP